MQRSDVRAGVVLLLLGFGLILSVIFLPRFHLSEISQRIEALQEKVVTLQKAVEKDGATRRRQRTQLASLSVEIAGIKRAYASLKDTISDAILAAGPTSDNDGLGGGETEPRDLDIVASGEAALETFLDVYASPLELPEEIVSKAMNVDERELIDGDSERLIRKLGEVGLAPVIDPGRLPVDLRERIRRLHGFYLLTYKVLRARARALHRQLAEKYTQEGTYFEFPIGTSPKEIQDAMRGSPEGVRFGQTLDDQGVHRIFVFPYAQHPEFDEIEARAQNARLHLIRDVGLLLETQ